MATTGTYTDNANNLAIISAALRKINRLGDFETLTTSDKRYVAALAALKLLCKEFANYGMPLWAIEELSIPFSNAGFTDINGVTIAISGADITNIAPMKVIQAIRRDGTQDIDVPMMMYTQDYYNTLSKKTVTGAPLGWTYYPTNTSVVTPVVGLLKVWPLPDTYWAANGSIYIRYQRPIQDVGTDTNDLDFPAEWQRAIVYSLAYDLAPEYGIDINLRSALKADKEQLVAQALSFMTEEGDFNIQPRIRW